MKGVVDVDTSLNAGKPEVSVRVDRPKAADLGVQIADAAEALRLLVGGDQVTTYNEGGEQYEVHLRAKAANRSTQEAVASLTVPSARLGTVSLDNVATFSRGSAPSDINRLRRQRQVTVFANLLPGGSQAEVQNAMEAEFKNLNAGPEYRGGLTGRSRELGRAAQNFILAFALSLIFMYLILAAQFESWLHPVTILLSLPLTLPFALLSIIIFQQSLNIFSALGLLVLFGVVKKNSILQIDHANQLKEKGLADARGDRAGQPRPAAAHPDDHVRVRGRHDPAHRLARDWLGHQPRHRIRHLRRPVAGAGADAGRDAGRLFPLRRPLSSRFRAQGCAHRARRLARGHRAVSGVTMRTTIRCTTLSFVLAAASAVSAQTPAPAVLRLTVDDAVKMALDHNVDLNADRLDPQISDTRVARRERAVPADVQHGPEPQQPDSPPSSFLIPEPTQNDAVTSSAGLSQRLPWYGTTYNVAFNAVHTNSNSFLSSYDPLVTSGLTLGISQPLVRDLFIDAARQNLVTSRINRDISDTRLRESIVHTTANTRSAYWLLVSALANVDARTVTLGLSQELTRVNKAKVDVGQSPPLDLVSAQAEVAANEEQLIIAQTLVRQAEDRLRLLIFDPTDLSIWNQKIEPVDSPPIAQVSLDVDAAVRRALGGRTDIARSKKDIENADASVKYAANQKLPDVRLNASYAASGLGGTQVLRTGAFPARSSGPGRSPISDRC